MTLTVVFVGLIAFAPQSSNTSWALLPDTSDEDGLPCNAYDGIPPSVPHAAYLIVPVEHLADMPNDEECPCGGGQVVDLNLRDAARTVSACTFKLDGHQISVGSSSDGRIGRETGAPRDSNGDLLFPVPRPRSNDERDFGWTRSLTSLAGELRARHACVEEDFRGGCDLVARVKIHDGTLATECVVPTGERCAQKYFTYGWVLRNDDEPSDEMAFSEGVEWTLDSESPFQIALHPLGELENSCSLTLKRHEQATAFVVHQDGEEPLHVLACNDLGGSPHEHMFRYFYKLTESEGKRDCYFPSKGTCDPEGYPRCPVALIDG